MKCVIYRLKNRARAHVVNDALEAGLKRQGIIPDVMDEAHYRAPIHDVALFYGYERNLPRIMKDYVASGRKVVFVDLGYWDRKTRGDRYGGFHKVCVNSRHPTDYFQKHKHDTARRPSHTAVFRPWRAHGNHILLAGMGDKASRAQGLYPGQWERAAVARLKGLTGRAIYYRPKPSWREAPPIPGTVWSPPMHSVTGVLQDCHAVVTHHSNISIEASLHGTPVFTEEGVGVALGNTDLAQIEKPHFTPDRGQWLNDIGYTQWTLAEMRLGQCWEHLRHEGLI